MLLYLIKVNLALGLLYILYRSLFRNDTFLKLRRITLLAILLFAILYPLPDIKHWIAQQPVLAGYIQAYSFVYQRNDAFLPVEDIPGYRPERTVETETATTPSSSVNRSRMAGQILAGIYISGILILLFRCMAEVFSVHGILRRSKRQIINGIPVYTSPEIEEPFSFFRWIFIQPGKYNRQTLSEILIHEETHVRHLHSLDVVLGEIITILCWVNPFARLLKKEITINHEYIADQEVMNAGFNKKEYQYHLIGLEYSPLAAANLYNYFSVLPLKKRITMLNKKRMHCARIIKYLALLPLAAVLLIVNNMDAMARIVPEQTEEIRPEPVERIEAPLPPDDDEVYTLVDVMPQYPGGIEELMKFINENLRYPEIAHKNGKQGRVTVSFIVEKDGSISNTEVVKGADPSLDEEALRVMKSLPKWTPGKKDGKVVRVRYNVPVLFKLS